MAQVTYIPGMGVHQQDHTWLDRLGGLGELGAVVPASDTGAFDRLAVPTHTSIALSKVE